MVAHSRRKRDRHKWPWLLQHIQVARDHEKEDQMKTYETPFILLLTLAKNGSPTFVMTVRKIDSVNNQWLLTTS